MGFPVSSGEVTKNCIDDKGRATKKFVDLRFVDLIRKNCGFEICRLSHLKSLRNYDSGMSARFCRFLILDKKYIYICVPTFALCTFRYSFFPFTLPIPFPYSTLICLGCPYSQRSILAAALDFDISEWQVN